jgi:hypothetical protein
MILLGLNSPHNIRTPWSKDSTFRNDVIACMMPFRRFSHIHNNFHLVDNATLPARETVAYKTARVTPLLVPLQEKCRSVYKANSRELSIDEGSMGWKGHSAMRQYNPNKPHKYHVKSYKLVETNTGYLSNIILHDTTSRTVDEVVLTLLDESPYDAHEGYALFTDRFYTSPDLFWYLRTVEGFDATGTCLPNRHQFPATLKTEKKGKKTEKGDVQSMIARKGEGAMMAMRWKDSKDVFMLSTEANAEMTDCPSQRGRLTIKKPAVIPLYNKYMGGVDLNDYLEAKYSPCRATRKMWRKLAMYLISTAVTNAYIIYGMVKKGRTVRQSAHFAFREKLGNVLLSMSVSQRLQGTTAVTPPIAINIGHLPMAYPPLASAVRKASNNPDADGKIQRQVHRCQMDGCKFKSIFYCVGCNKCFCVKSDKHCFYEYHKKLAASALIVDGQQHVPAAAPAMTVPPETNFPSSENSSDGDVLQETRMQPRRAAKRTLVQSEQAPTPTPGSPKRARRARRRSAQ